MKKDKKDKILVIQKFQSSQKVTGILLVSFFIILILYVLTLVLLQIDSVSDNQMFADGFIVLLNVLKDFFLVIISIIGTTLLTSALIEKNQKNATYTELLANDIFASPEFYSNLSDENKQKMIESLERNYYKRHPVKQELFSAFRDTLNTLKYEYYYEECNINVSYFQKENYTEKLIVRTIKLRSYSDEIQLPQLHLCGYSLGLAILPNSETALEPFEFISLNIDGIEKSVSNNIVITKKETTNQLLKKCGYSVYYSAELKNSIKIRSDQDLVIRIEYKSRVTDEDNSMSFRVDAPCRKYLLNFYAPENYRVWAHAFGAFDVASNSSNGIYDNAISVKFDNWLLPENGVTICCSEKLSFSSKQERQLQHS